jgi:hypothetical protein
MTANPARTSNAKSSNSVEVGINPRTPNSVNPSGVAASDKAEANSERCLLSVSP